MGNNGEKIGGGDKMEVVNYVAKTMSRNGLGVRFVHQMLIGMMILAVLRSITFRRNLSWKIQVQLIKPVMQMDHNYYKYL